MKTTQLRIRGMTCQKCVARVQKALQALPGVREAKVTADAGATVTHDDLSEEMLVRAVGAAGDYRAEVVQPATGLN